MAKATKLEERPVIVCTDKKGVFFGYATDTSGRDVKLSRARMCVYWTTETHGVLGLAAKGPQKGCKVTDAVPMLDAREVHAVIDVSPEAVTRWEEGPWA